MQVVLYILCFIFGYVTCRTFYFFKATRVGLQVLEMARLVSLSVLIKGLEHYNYLKMSKIKEIVFNGGDQKQIDNFEKLFNNEIEYYKRDSIKAILSEHPQFFKGTVQFNDWNSAMLYLRNNKQLLFKLRNWRNNDP